MSRTRVAVVVLGLVVAGCGGSGGGHASTTSTTSTTTTTAPPSTTAAPTTSTTSAGPRLSAVRLRLTKVAGLTQPLAMTWCPGDPQPYVAQKTGQVRRLDGTTVLDLSGSVTGGGEQGLLGIACSPDGAAFYASYTDRGGDSRLDRFARATDGRITGGTNLLLTRQPAPNHNGGNILFGPDGLLWYGLGDGGGADDRFNHAQKPGDRLGSIMRLDPAKPEPQIVIKGARNPWRWSFDRATHDLWIGDVGQGTIEEVDKLAAGSIDGANLGWPAFEGTNRYRKDVAPPPGAVPPVFQYDHSQGQSIAGGYVYRGKAIPALVGAYLFADTYVGQLRAIAVRGQKTIDQRDLGSVPGRLVASFAEDPAGEVYVLSLAGGIYRLDAA
jgi:glucose/arabinose dehydrogenase